MKKRVKIIGFLIGLITCLLFPISIYADDPATNEIRLAQIDASAPASKAVPVLGTNREFQHIRFRDMLQRLSQLDNFARYKSAVMASPSSFIANQLSNGGWEIFYVVSCTGDESISTNRNIRLTNHGGLKGINTITKGISIPSGNQQGLNYAMSVAELTSKMSETTPTPVIIYYRVRKSEGAFSMPTDIVLEYIELVK